MTQETKSRILWMVHPQPDPRRGPLKPVSLTKDPQMISPGPILPVPVQQETTETCTWQEASGRHNARYTVLLTGEPSRTSLGIHSTWVEPGAAGPQFLQDSQDS